MNLFSKKFMVFVFFVGCFLGVPKEACAIFSLSVTPAREIRGITFEQPKPGAYSDNREVTLSVTTTQATQYTIYQTVYQPLTNEMGNTIPQGAFIFFSPSTPTGTLRTQLETPVAMGQIPVYTSNAAGDSDSFVLVYNVKIPENQPGGTYRTQIIYTAQLVTAKTGISQSTMTMDVVVTLRPTFKVTIQNTKGARELDLGHITKDRAVGQDILALETQSNTGPYVINQQLVEPLTSLEGQSLDESEFKVMGSGGDKGVLSAKGVEAPVTLSPQRLYVSDSGAGDKIALQYTASPDSAQKAGIYKGMLSFKVDSNSQEAPMEPINIPAKIEIDTIFYLDFNTDTESDTKINFGVFKNKDEKHEKKINLSIHSNLGQPYQVVQIVTNKFTTETGEVIPTEDFTFFGAEAQTGKLATLSPVPVKEGEMVVFTSDNKGTPEKFILDYELKAPVSTKAGSYSTNIRYSITTL